MKELIIYQFSVARETDVDLMTKTRWTPDMQLVWESVFPGFQYFVAQPGDIVKLVVEKPEPPKAG